MTDESNNNIENRPSTKYTASDLSKNKVKNLLDEICKGNTLLCRKNRAGKFDKDLTLLLLLVGNRNGDAFTVPYYDVKRANLWQDLFVWYGKSVLELDFNDSEHIEKLYRFTKSVKAQGFTLYLSAYSRYTKLVDKDKNKARFYFPEQISSTDIIRIKAMGTIYPALDQVHDNYNNLMIKPRFNVVEAIINWNKATGQWLDPNWLEQQSKDWASSLGTSPQGNTQEEKERYVQHRELLMAADYSFDNPDWLWKFTFVKEEEKPNDLEAE